MGLRDDSSSGAKTARTSEDTSYNENKKERNSHAGKWLEVPPGDSLLYRGTEVL